MSMLEPCVAPLRHDIPRKVHQQLYAIATVTRCICGRSTSLLASMICCSSCFTSDSKLAPRAVPTTILPASPTGNFHLWFDLLSC